MTLLYKLTLSFFALASLGACMQGPGWTHGQPLPDGSGAIVYDCRPLEGEAATAALHKSHSLYVSKYHKQNMAYQRKLEQLQKQGGLTQEQIVEVNEETYARKAAVRDATAALGCEMKGQLAEGSRVRG